MVANNQTHLKYQLTLNASVTFRTVALQTPHMANHTSFDPRNYGFKKLGELFQAIDLFEMKKTQGSVYWVQEKKRWK